MSEHDQQHTLSLISALLKKRGASRFIAFILALPIIIGTISALFMYNFTAVNYMREMNFAKNNVPVLGAALKGTDDSLRAHGYSIPQFVLISR